MRVVVETQTGVSVGAHETFAIPCCVPCCEGRLGLHPSTTDRTPECFFRTLHTVLSAVSQEEVEFTPIQRRDAADPISSAKQAGRHSLYQFRYGPLVARSLGCILRGGRGGKGARRNRCCSPTLAAHPFRPRA